MTSGFSLRGSGIYSGEIDLEIVCSEKCEECAEVDASCSEIFTFNANTDDWGYIDAKAVCPTCKHEISIHENTRD
jgi:hypothetical protein